MFGGRTASSDHAPPKKHPLLFATGGNLKLQYVSIDPPLKETPMASEYQLTKNDNTYLLQVLGSQTNVYMSGQLHQWAGRINCERSNCKDKQGSYHADHGKIIKFDSKEQAENWAELRRQDADHQDDVLHRVILVPSWDVINASTDLPKVDLTEV